MLGLNKQGMNDVVYREKRSFGFAILGRGIWTRKIKKYAMREKEGAIASVVKFTTIVTLNKSNEKTEVRDNILTKVEKYSVDI
jgi:hypothetical protein